MNDATHPSDFGLGDDRIGKRLFTQCRNIDEEFLQTLVALAHETVPRLQWKVVYKAQDVIGREFWDKLENWPRRLAGQVLAHLVVKKMLPLLFASCRLCTTKHYERC